MVIAFTSFPLVLSVLWGHDSTRLDCLCTYELGWFKGYKKVPGILTLQLECSECSIIIIFAFDFFFQIIVCVDSCFTLGVTLKLR